MFTNGILENLTPEQMLARHNSTYSAKRAGDPGDFGAPAFFDLSKGADDEIQPTFTAAGDTMYFVSTRNPLIGAAIYRSGWDAGSRAWGARELVIRGVVGEPSLTADGRYPYFVHVLGDAQGNCDTDVWYCERAR